MADALIIQVDSSQVEKGKRSLADLASQGAKTETAIGGLGKTGRSAASGMEALSSGAKSASLSAGSLLTSVKGLAVGYIGVGAALKAIQSIDTFTKFNAQLKLATRSQEEFAIATSSVSDIAKIAQANIASIGTLYSRINNSVRELGASQKETADITENVALALKISGATAQETSSAILQLSQAFGSGVLRGEEFNAVNESAPALMRALAESIGVPVGKLRELASNGEITGNVLLKAFGDDNLLNKFREQAKEVQTISGGWEVFTNQLVVAIGKINEATGASKLLVGVLSNAATLLSIFEGGEKGSILRNFLDKSKRFEEKRLAGLGIPELKKLTSFGNAAAKLALDNKLAAANPKFGGDISSQVFTPKFGSEIVAQDVNKIHQAQEVKLTRIKQASTAATDALRKAEEERKRKLDEHFDILRAGVEAEYAYNESLKEVRNTIFAAIEAEQGRLDSTQRQIDVLSIGEKGINDRETAEIRNTIAINASNAAFLTANALQFENNGYVQAAIDAIGEQNKAYEKLIETKDKNIEKDLILQSFKLDKEQADNRIKEAERAIKEIEDESKRSSQEIGKSLTDALLRGFESGKGFAKNFKDTLINLFKTLILRPAIQFLVDSSGITKALSGISGAFSGGGATAIGGYATGGTTGGSGLFGGLKDILTKGNNSLVNSIGSLGATLSNFGSTGTGFIKDIASKAGSFLQLNTGLISKALPYAGAIVSLLKGDIKGAALTAIGTFLGGPIGGAIGGLLGSFLGKSKKSYANGTFNSSFEGGTFAQGSASTNSRGALATGALPAINEVTETFAARLSILFKEFGLSDKQKFTTVIKFGKQLEASFASSSAAGGGAAVDGYGGNNYGSDAQAGMTKFIADILGKGLQGAITSSSLSGGIKKFFNALTKQEDVLDAINSIVTLNRQLGDLPKVFNAIRDAIDTTSYQTSIADLKARFAAIGTYTSLFYTAEEQFATFTKQLSSQLSALGTGLPTSRDEYRRLVDGINVTDATTSGLFNGLVALAPAMDAYFKQLEQQEQLKLELAEQQKAALAEQKAVADALARSMDSLRTEDLFKTLTDFNRYLGVANNYGSDRANRYVDNVVPLRKLPSFATGADMLPNDMVAQVHAGERIVPAADNQAIIQALNGGTDLKQLIKDLIVEVRSGNISMVQAAQKTAKVMQRIDDEGVMINETNNAGVRTVLNVRTVA